MVLTLPSKQSRTIPNPLCSNFIKRKRTVLWRAGFGWDASSLTTQYTEATT